MSSFSFKKNRVTVNFTRWLTEANFLSTDWLSYLRTQLKALLAKQEIFLIAVLSNNFFLLKQTLHPEIWTVASLTYKQQTSANCLFRNIFFSETDFCTITSHFLNPISKMFCKFVLQLNMAKRRHCYGVFWVLKPKKKLDRRKTKFALTCSFQKVIRRLAFSGCEKFDNSFYFELRGIV